MLEKMVVANHQHALSRDSSSDTHALNNETTFPGSVVTYEKGVILNMNNSKSCLNKIRFRNDNLIFLAPNEN